jgi:hypothetical protein
MPAFVVAALVTAGVATGVAVVAGTIGATALTWAAIGNFFMTTFVTTAVLGGVARALQKNPRGDPAVQSSGRTITLRQAISPWEVVLGKCRKGGILTFRYISEDKRFWHMIITVAGHRCQAIDEVWLNDEVLALDSNGQAQGKWVKTTPPIENVHEAAVPGSPFQITVPTTVTAVQAVFLDQYGDGVFWPCQEVTPATPTSLLQYSRSGNTFSFHSGAQGKTAHIRTFNSTENSHIRVKISLGNEGTSTQPFPDLVAESNGRWTNDHKQYGHTKVYIRLEANPDLFPFGVPNFSFVVRGAADVFDPRGGTSYSNNAALALNWYMTNAEFGPGYDYSTEIHEADLITAANDADVAVPLAAGGSEPRYTVNGSFSTSEQPKAVLERMLAACAGSLVDLGDKWRVNMGVYHAPTVTLTERHLAGPSVINPYLSARDNANGAKGIFTNPNAKWQPDDFPAIPGTTFLSADGGKRQWLDMDLTAFVTSGTQAQRLAKIALFQRRQALSADEVFNLTAWSAVPGRTVARTDAQLGWSAKEFEIVDSELVVAGSENPVLAVKHQMRETAAAIYDWSTSEEGIEDLAPNTDLPEIGEGLDIFDLTLSSGTADLFVAGDGTVVSRIRATWRTTGMPWIRHYETQYKRSTDANWLVGAPISPPLGTVNVTVFLSPVEDGVNYDVRVRAVETVGISGAWTQAAPHMVVGKTELPPDVVTFTIEGKRLSWGLVTATDVNAGGGYLIKYQPGTSRSWGDAIPINDGVLTSSPYDMLVVPTGPVTIMIKAVDSSGNESQNAAHIVTDLGDPFVANVVETFDRKAAGFPGTKTACTVSGGNLVADSITPLMWKPDDSAAMWSSDSGDLMWATVQYAAMTYEDTVTVSEALSGSRMTIQQIIQGDPWSIEYRENSAALAWNADDSTLAWATDDTTLAWDLPDFLPWPGEIIAANSLYDFRVTAGQSQTQGIVSELTITIDAPDIEESLDNVVISVGGTRLPITESFTFIKNVQVTVQSDGGSAISARVDDKVTTVGAGPLVHGLDATGANTSALIDARIQGW